MATLNAKHLFAEPIFTCFAHSKTESHGIRYMTVYNNGGRGSAQDTTEIQFSICPKAHSAALTKKGHCFGS